jgi:hypothetical protein
MALAVFPYSSCFFDFLSKRAKSQYLPFFVHGYSGRIGYFKTKNGSIRGLGKYTLLLNMEAWRHGDVFFACKLSNG